ncbi:MAG TPA: potassium channel protein [Syntrophales bacterium]|nr:potassium channel protein [Syntrophales bacterium]
MPNNLKIALIFIMILIVIGTVGFYFIEGWNVLESFYTTVMTLTTIGYGDFVPRTQGGMLFTVILVIFGVGTMLYTVGLVAQTMVEGRLMNLMGRGKMEKAIEKMNNHYIICGCGRIGMLIARELAAEKVPFVVIDNNPEAIQRIQEEGFVFFRGDATHDKCLIGAGIKRARGIVCVLSSDAQNLYVILTAKELNPNLWILSRSEEEQSEHRLLRAGADRVMSPYTLGGSRMAMAILRPAMLDFIEITTRRQSLELRMDEMEICEGSPLIGKSLEESEIRQRYGLIIVAVKKESGKMIFNPVASYVIQSGDKLIALGEEDNVSKLSQVCLV